MTNKNGCRAPFWRQMYGDLSYITVKPYDSEDVHITASTYGYFINGVRNSSVNISHWISTMFNNDDQHADIDVYCVALSLIVKQLWNRNYKTTSRIAINSFVEIVRRGAQLILKMLTCYNNNIGYKFSGSCQHHWLHTCILSNKMHIVDRN